MMCQAGDQPDAGEAPKAENGAILEARTSPSESTFGPGSSRLNEKTSFVLYTLCPLPRLY